MLDREEILTIIALTGIGFLFMGAMCWIASFFDVPFIIIW